MRTKFHSDAWKISCCIIGSQGLSILYWLLILVLVLSVQKVLSGSGRGLCIS